MLLFILAALLGAFAPGLLSNATAGTADGPLRVTYHRFERFQRPMTLN